ncbi:MAG: YciI family protein, partial [Myxococcota bacterium]
MQYLLLLHGDEAVWTEMSEDDRRQAIQSYMAYNGELASSGVLRAGGELAASHTATTLRGQAGQVRLTDGPFAETREQIGGFYVIEVESLDEALSWARRCPALWGGSI